jgi:hypothetical protein
MLHRVLHSSVGTMVLLWKAHSCYSSQSPLAVLFHSVCDHEHHPRIHKVLQSYPHGCKGGTLITILCLLDSPLTFLQSFFQPGSLFSIFGNVEIWPKHALLNQWQTCGTVGLVATYQTMKYGCHLQNVTEVERSHMSTVRLSIKNVPREVPLTRPFQRVPLHHRWQPLVLRLSVCLHAHRKCLRMSIMRIEQF